MSVKLIDNAAFYGYRVRRTILGKLYQEYFSLKANGKRLTGNAKKAVENQAKVRDNELIALQKQAKVDNKSNRCFKRDGSIRGISFIKKVEKSGTVIPIFQVGIASEIDKKVICTSFSIRAHGLEGAWRKTVNTYAKHKKISHRSELYQQLIEGMPEINLSEFDLDQPKPKRTAATPKTAKASSKASQTSNDKRKRRWSWF